MPRRVVRVAAALPFFISVPFHFLPGFMLMHRMRGPGEHERPQVALVSVWLGIISLAISHLWLAIWEIPLTSSPLVSRYPTHSRRVLDQCTPSSLPFSISEGPSSRCPSAPTESFLLYCGSSPHDAYSYPYPRARGSVLTLRFLSVSHTHARRRAPAFPRCPASVSSTDRIRYRAVRSKRSQAELMV